MAATRLRLVLGLLVNALTSPVAARESGVAVFGYVPEYRILSVNWERVADETTHIMLFSAEVGKEGDIHEFERFMPAFTDGSPLVAAMGARHRTRLPKVLITLGGAGRSANFAQGVSTSAKRKKLAGQIAMIFEKLPYLSGIDLDWEVPQSADEWKNLGRLAKEIRTQVSPIKPDALITMTYHPRSGAVKMFSGLKSKKSDESFVDFFDYCHGMTYSMFDHERKHSTPAMDRAAIEEWKNAGLPLSKLTLGLPFFGVDRKSGKPLTYGEIIDEEPSLVDRPGVDVSKSGVYFPNARSMANKVQMAAEFGLGGVMIWELGQDKGSDHQSLLRHVWAASKGTQVEKTWLEIVYTQIHGFGLDQIVACLSALVGAVMFFKVLTYEHPSAKYAAPREVRNGMGAAPEPQPEGMDAPLAAAGETVAEAVAETDQPTGAEDEAAEEPAEDET